MGTGQAISMYADKNSCKREKWTWTAQTAFGYGTLMPQTQQGNNRFPLNYKRRLCLDTALPQYDFICLHSVLRDFVARMLSQSHLTCNVPGIDVYSENEWRRLIRGDSATPAGMRAVGSSLLYIVSALNMVAVLEADNHNDCNHTTIGEKQVGKQIPCQTVRTPRIMRMHSVA